MSSVPRWADTWTERGEGEDVVVKAARERGNAYYLYAYPALGVRCVYGCVCVGGGEICITIIITKRKENMFSYVRLCVHEKRIK